MQHRRYTSVMGLNDFTLCRSQMNAENIIALQTEILAEGTSGNSAQPLQQIHSRL
jgi:hypothetical protein